MSEGLGPHGYIELPSYYEEVVDNTFVESKVKEALRKLSQSNLPARLYNVDEGIKYELHEQEGRVFVYFETQPR